MEISAALVKELRERTGSGMMECKKALTETGGDIESAVELMRKKGMARADKKADRVAAEGRIAAAVSTDGSRAAMVEINCETDFVAKGDDFAGFCDSVAREVLEQRPGDLAALMELPLGGSTVETMRRELIVKLGENINVRRFALVGSPGGMVGSYLHGTRIGVLAELKGGDAALSKDIAMHIAASKPAAVRPEDVSADLVQKEREIFEAQAAQSGKPAEIIAKMVVGRVNKFLSEVTLLGQPFVKNPDITVGQLAKDSGADVLRFVRYEVGEGIEKKADNFAEEVMAQVRGN